MKRCKYCGKEYPDEMSVCPIDQNTLQPTNEIGIAVSQAIKAPQKSMTVQERRFWEQMTFKQFAIILIRIQALWLLFYAFIDATYIPGYFTGLYGVTSWTALSHGDRIRFVLLLFHIVLRIAAAVLLIQKAERILGWLVRDYILDSPTKESDRVA
jgi:hypothetical protein